MPKDATAPESSPLLPGLSRAQVAANLGISERTVTRIEEIALAKARAELERQGLSFQHFLAMLRRPESES